MRKLFTALATLIYVTVAAFAASAQSQEALTFVPESGTAVPQLSTISVTLTDDAYYGVWVERTYFATDVVVKKDGATFCGATAAYTDEAGTWTHKGFEITLNTPATEPGVYTIDIPANYGLIKLNASSSYPSIGLSLSYTVTGGGVVDPQPEVKLVTEPADNETVTVLDKIRLSSDNDDYSTVEVLDASTITVTRDGASCSRVEFVNGELSLYVSQTEAGSYVVTLPAGSYQFKNAEGKTISGDETILHYTIEATAQTSVSLVLSPADGETVEDLSTIVTWPEAADGSSWYVEYTDVDAIFVEKNDAYVTGVTEEYGMLTLKQPQTEPGTYILNIPANSYRFKSEDGTQFIQGEAVTSKYIIEDNTQTSALVKADPMSGSTVKELSSVTVSSNVAEYPIIYLSNSSPMKVTKDGVDFCGVSYTNNFIARTSTIKLKTPATEPGVYEITLPKDSWAIGDDNSNMVSEDLVLTYTIEGVEPVVKYELIPTVTPYDGKELTSGEELKRVSFSFPEGTELLSQEARLTLECAEAGYAQTAFIMLDKTTEGTDPVYYVEFEPAPSAFGTYTMTVEKETFAIKGASEVNANNDMNLSWTIKEATDPLTPTSVSPAPLSSVNINDFNIIALVFPEGTTLANTEGDTTGTLTCATAGYSNTVYVMGYNAPTFETFPYDIYEAGDYTLTIPAGAFTLTENGVTRTNEELTYTWTVTAATADALVPTSIEPAPDSDVTVTDGDNPFGWMTVTFPEGTVWANADVVATMTCPETGFSKSATFMNWGDNDFFLSFEGFTADGEYVLTIAADQFSKEENGVTLKNEELTYRYNVTVTGNIECHDLEPLKTTPADNDRVNPEWLKKIVLVFPEGTEIIDAEYTGKTVNLFKWTEDPDETSAQITETYTAEFKADTENPGTFYLEFDNIPAEIAWYSLDVASRQFKLTEAPAESPAMRAPSSIVHYNNLFRITWYADPSITTGIDGIDADKAAQGVYNLNGIYMGDSLKDLPAGIYLMKGSKVVKK